MTHTRPSSRPAITLIECVVCTLVVSLLLVAAVSTVASARAGERSTQDRANADTLAESLMREIQAQAYSDASDTPASSGPTPAEAATGNRSLFNDVNDYAGWSESPPLNKAGASLGLDATWRREVRVEFVVPASPGSSSATDQGLATVRVRVSRNNVPLVTLSSLRSAGLPATEAFRLPDGSFQNLIPIHGQSLSGTSQGPGTNAWSLPEPPDSGYGLVAHWKMNENNGTQAQNAVSTNHATLVNGPTFTSGQFGNCLRLDGVNDYARAVDQPVLSPVKAFTIAAWVYLETIPTAGRYQIALHKGANTTDWNYGLGITNRKVLLDFASLAGGEQEFTGGTINTARRWYHIAATFDDNANTVKLYIDGAAVATITTTAAPLANTGQLWIGSSPFNDFLNGRIDDARIYERVLSATEIQALFNGGEP